MHGTYYKKGNIAQNFLIEPEYYSRSIVFIV